MYERTSKLRAKLVGMQTLRSPLASPIGGGGGRARGGGEGIAGGRFRTGVCCSGTAEVSRRP